MEEGPQGECAVPAVFALRLKCMLWCHEDTRAGVVQAGLDENGQRKQGPKMACCVCCVL